MQRQFDARNTKNQVLGQVNTKVKDMWGKHEPALAGSAKSSVLLGNCKGPLSLAYGNRWATVKVLEVRS